MRTVLGLILIAIVAAGAYLLAWPVPIEPVAWNPRPAPGLTGPYASNQRLAAVEWLAKGVAIGPEDVAVDARGRIYGGYADGRIRRFDADGGNPEILADTGGRPLGLAWAPSGELIIADAVKGLLALGPDGGLRVLTDRAGGRPLGFADDVDVAADGSVYFSDASTYGVDQALAAILEHGGHGRLIRYEPASATTTVLLDGLQFANGVAVGPEERYVLVNETGAYRITQYWLKGPKAGSHEVFFANLPGLPDGIAYDGEDRFWVAMYAPRNALLDCMADKPFLRKLVYRLPAWLQPGPANLAFALGIDTRGRVVANLQDAGAGAYAPITSVEPVAGTLYFGSLTQAAIARLPAP